MFQVPGRRADSLRIGLYTNFLDTTIAEVELRLPWDLIEMLMGHALPGVSGRHYIRPTAEQVVRAAFDALGIS